MKIRAIAIDDNQSALNIIESLCKKLDYLELVSKFTNALEAGNFLKSNENVDLLFLDINMPEMNGLEFLKIYKPDQAVIFISKHTEHAIDTYAIQNEYDIKVIDFLPLPVQQARFIQACNKAYEIIKESLDSIVLKDNKKRYKVKFDSIVLIEADETDGHFMNFYLSAKYDGKDKLLIRKSLADLEKQLPTGTFIRVNKGSIVNINKIEMMDGDEIVIPQRRLPIGEKYRSLIDKIIGK